MSVGGGRLIIPFSFLSFRVYLSSLHFFLILFLFLPFYFYFIFSSRAVCIRI